MILSMFEVFVGWITSSNTFRRAFSW